MRKLLLVRGPQGSGKSTLIANLGLAPYALSLDTIRHVVAAPTLTSDGRMSVAGEFDEAVLKLHRDLVTERMKRGELMVIEQAVMLGEDVERYMALGQAHGYAIRLVDLTNMPLDQVLAQNAGRPELTRVPVHAVRRTHLRLSSSPMPTCPPSRRLNPLDAAPDQAGHRDPALAETDHPTNSPAGEIVKSAESGADFDFSQNRSLPISPEFGKLNPEAPATGLTTGEQPNPTLGASKRRFTMQVCKRNDQDVVDILNTNSDCRGFGFFATLPQLMRDTSYIKDKKFIAEYRKITKKLQLEERKKI